MTEYSSEIKSPIRIAQSFFCTQRKEQRKSFQHNYLFFFASILKRERLLKNTFGEQEETPKARNTIKGNYAPENGTKLFRN